MTTPSAPPIGTADTSITPTAGRTRVILNADLNAKVAMMAVPAIARLAWKAEVGARAAAPRVKIWRTAFDAKVRPWHVSAEGQKAPDNLRFALDQSPRTYRQHTPPKAVMWGVRYSPDKTEYLREPRDPSAHWTQRDWCRCFMDHDNSLAESISRGPVVISGSKVTCEVATRFPRAAESEFGTLEDTPALYMTRGGAAARL